MARSDTLLPCGRPPSRTPHYVLPLHSVAPSVCLSVYLRVCCFLSDAVLISVLLTTLSTAAAAAANEHFACLNVEHCASACCSCSIAGSNMESRESGQTHTEENKISAVVDLYNVHRALIRRYHVFIFRRRVELGIEPNSNQIELVRSEFCQSDSANS